MSLTRAQLLSGDTSQGTVLRGQVQGVKRGVGITISANGAISVDPVTITGVVKTNNVSAFNSYIWPSLNGTDNQVLTTADDGTLRWDDVSDDFFKNVFTAKGQLIVGTGVKTYTLQNVGINTAFAVADSATTSGLIYTNNMTSAVLLPVGDSAQRDCYCIPTDGPLTGQFRYSTTFNTLEFYNGVKWVQVHATDFNIETFVHQTVPLVGTPSAVIVPGTTAQRQNDPQAGYFRYNTTEGVPEFYDGIVWRTFIHEIDPGTTGLTFTGIPTPEAGIVQVGGTLVLANGGTGATTQPGAANNILPPQSANDKKFLTTDGTNVSWSTLDGNGALTAGPGISVATAGTNITTVSNTGVLSNIGGFGINVSQATGNVTISLASGLITNYPPQYLVPGTSVVWGEPGGMGAVTQSLGPYQIDYPAGAEFALLQTRTRCEITSVGGGDYSAAAGFGFITNPRVDIQVTGEALPDEGDFQEGLAGLIAGYSSGTFYNTGAFLTRTDQVALVNPAGGSFFITLNFSQLASGPNSIRFGFPQIVILPFSLS